MFRIGREPVSRILLVLSLFLVLAIGLTDCEDSTKSSGSGVYSSEWVITIQPVFSTLKADGASSTHVMITVRNRNGTKPDTTTDTTLVYLSVDLGSITSSATLDSDGQAVVYYTAASTPGNDGKATIRATYKGSLGSATIELYSSSI